MAKDPYRYFRIEAADLLEQLGQGVLELERSGLTEDTRRRLLRYAHTLKGAARVVELGDFADGAHELEDHLVALPQSPDAAAVRRLFDSLDRLRAELSLVRIEPPTRDAAAPAPVGAEGTVRVDLAALDALIDRFFDVAVAAAKLTPVVEGLRALERRLEEASHSRAAGEVEGAQRARSAIVEDAAGETRRLRAHLATHLELFDREIEMARTSADEIRLVAAGSILPDLERAVRDAANELGRATRFECLGGGVRLDAHVLSRVREALLHVVRNAVAHGIEDDRSAAGKPHEGQVTLVIERRGHRISFACRDDGRGISSDDVRGALLRRGHQEAASLSRDELLGRLAHGGVTTQDHVTAVAGRGLGLEVARRIAEELGGQLVLESTPDLGTTVSLVVAVSLACLPVLGVADAGIAAVIPLDAVRATRRIAGSDITVTASGECIEDGGRAVPLLQLGWALGQAPTSREPDAMYNVVVIEAAGGTAAVAVEKLYGVESAVVRSLPPTARTTSVVSGASLVVDGPPRLVLAGAALVERAAERPAVAARGPVAHLAPILVIDDSLTTRMLEQSILESAGFEVALASSAEEGLEKARRQRYALFIVDVEMPGMNGFEFLEVVRSDAALRDVPAVVVTSRGSREDIERGKNLGARAYVVKGEFNQEVLLETVRRLIG